MSLQPTIESYITNLHEDGSGIFSDYIKLHLFHNEKNIFKLLSFEDDNTFLEPLLNLKESYNPFPEFSITQVLFGYMADDKAPKEIEVYSDCTGKVYLPKIGYFLSHVRDSLLLLRKGHDDYYLLKDGITLDFKFYPITFIPHTNIEIVEFNNPLLNAKFEGDYSDNNVLIKNGFDNYADTIISVLEKIGECSTWFHALIINTIKKIVLFENTTNKSFASLNTLGINYINTNLDRGFYSILESFVYLSFRNIYFISVFENTTYFNIEVKKGYINAFNKNTADQRYIGSIVGSAFSILAICRFYSKLINKENYLDAKDHIEIHARLIFNIRKLGRLLSDIDFPEIFTPEGLNFYHHLNDEYKSLNSQNLNQTYIFYNQGEIFDMNLFIKVNMVSVNAG